MDKQSDDALVAGLRRTATILRTQADLAHRVSETYAPEREQWEQSKGDDRLTQMIRYQIDQEQLARSLTKDAEEAEQAADAIEALHAREAAAKADAKRLAGFVAQVAERDDSLGDDAKEALAAGEKQP